MIFFVGVFHLEKSTPRKSSCMNLLLARRKLKHRVIDNKAINYHFEVNTDQMLRFKSIPVDSKQM